MWLLILFLVVGLMIMVVRESRMLFYRDVRFWLSLTCLLLLMGLSNIF